jgi:hypothetical protein
MNKDAVMGPKEFYRACVTQCEWCQERWPLVMHKGHAVHVAPFTKDPALFYWTCAANAVRVAFNYMEYNGAPLRYTWRPPSAAKLMNSRRAITDPHCRAFWRHGCHCTLSVNSWPAWKRSIGNEATPAQIKASTARTRAEIVFYDAFEYYARQTCTQGQKYRPVLSQRWNEPTCNHGIGCIECWGKYRAAVDKYEQEHPCDI